MQVILSVSSDNPNYNADCDFALLDLTQDLARLALRRIAQLRRQHKRDAQAYETYYWSLQPQYFRRRADEDNDADDMSVAWEQLEEKVDSRELVVAPDGFSVPEGQIARVECGQMAVRDDAIVFTAIPKHTSFFVRTAKITRDFLRCAANPKKSRALEPSVMPIEPNSNGAMAARFTAAK